MQTLFLQTISIAVYTNYIIEIDERKEGPNPWLFCCKKVRLCLFTFDPISRTVKKKKRFSTVLNQEKLYIYSKCNWIHSVI